MRSDNLKRHAMTCRVLKYKGISSTSKDISRPSSPASPSTSSKVTLSKYDTIKECLLQGENPLISTRDLVKQAAMDISSERSPLVELRPWQQALMDALPLQSDREIYFISDPVGNTGKSALCKYLQACENFCCVSWSPRVHHAIFKCFTTFNLAAPVNILINMSRSDSLSSHISKLEKLKDGDLESYTGEQIKLPFVRLIIFSNMPLSDILSLKLTSDRFVVYGICDNDLVRQHPALPPKPFVPENFLSSVSFNDSWAEVFGDIIENDVIENVDIPSSLVDFMCNHQNIMYNLIESLNIMY